jgi:hypothetical protein
MKAHAMANATSMARRMRKSISPQEGPPEVACEFRESFGTSWGAPDGESVGGCIHPSVRRRNRWNTP